MQSDPSETPAMPPFSGSSAAFLEVSWTSAIDPKYGVSLQEHSLPTDALCPPSDKYSSWSVLELDGIFWENYTNISNKDYRREIVMSL